MPGVRPGIVVIYARYSHQEESKLATQVETPRTGKGRVTMKQKRRAYEAPVLRSHGTLEELTSFKPGTKTKKKAGE